MCDFNSSNQITRCVFAFQRCACITMILVMEKVGRHLAAACHHANAILYRHVLHLLHKVWLLPWSTRGFSPVEFSAVVKAKGLLIKSAQDYWLRLLCCCLCARARGITVTKWAAWECSSAKRHSSISGLASFALLLQSSYPLDLSPLPHPPFGLYWKL